MSDEIAFRHADPGEQPRRDFLFAATGAVGVGAAVWPLIDALNPSAEVLSLASIEVDLSGIEVGQRITVKSRGRPVFIWWRSPADIANARATPLDDLVDPVDRASENPDHVGGMPALDCNRSVDEAGEWLVTIGVCTHPGCVPLGQSGASVGDRGGWLPLPPVACRRTRHWVRKATSRFTRCRLGLIDFPALVVGGGRWVVSISRNGRRWRSCWNGGLRKARWRGFSG